MTSISWRGATRRLLRPGLAALGVLALSAVFGVVPSSEGDSDGGGRGGDGDRAERQQVENPYAGAVGYVDPEYALNVQASARREGGPLGATIQKLASVSTAVWLDRIATVTGGPGAGMTLLDHMEAALTQQRRARRPVAIMLVLYNLPNRDCAALASAGELLVARDGERRYRAEFVDPVAEIIGHPRYAALRKVVVVEPDSLPNMVTNRDEPRCAEVHRSGAYVDGIRYVLDRLRPLRQTYLYLDLAHSAWLGGDPTFGDAVKVYGDAVRGARAGVHSIHGFVTNVSNYVPTEEPFLPDSNVPFGDVPLRANRFHGWNPYFDELDYAQAMRRAFVDGGFPRGIGMLIDTGRNGWGGPDRPTGTSRSDVLDTYVAETRVDRRPVRSDWCNQQGAGLGSRPRANPAEGIHAFVWVKAPGESDGVSEPDQSDPADPNKALDPMCDPGARNRYDPSAPTNALDGAPHAGRWFHAQLVMLVRNAHPPL